MRCARSSRWAGVALRAMDWVVVGALVFLLRSRAAIGSSWTVWPAGGSREITQKMVVDGAAKPGVYVLDVSISYDDADGQTRTGSEVVTLLVSRRVDLELSELDVTTEAVTGEPVPFAVELINAGTATVNVGNVRVEGGRSMDVQADPRFIGPLDSSAADLIEAMLVPRGVGESIVTVVVEYLDDFNQQQTFEQEFTFEISEPTEEDLSEEMEVEPPPSRSLFMRILRGLFGFGASETGGVVGRG